MAASDSTADDKRVFDVEKPGKSAPDTTSRPVIVGHGPMMEDPMVHKQETVDTYDTAAHRPSGSVGNVKQEMKIDQLADDKKTEPSTEKTSPVDEGTDVKKDDDSTDVDKTEVSETKQPKEAAESQPSSNESAVVDAVVDQAGAKKKEQDVSDEELAKRAHIEKLIDEKTFFVKVGQVRRKRNTIRLLEVILLLLIVTIITGYVLIDAGIVQSNIKLPHKFLK